MSAFADDTALAAADRAAAPAVAQPASRLLLAAGMVIIVLSGVATFFGLHKTAGVQSAQDNLPISTKAPSTSADLPPPPVLASPVIAQAATPQPVILANPLLPAARLRQPIQRPSEPVRQTTPALIVDLTPPEATAATTAKPGTVVAADKLPPNEAFAERIARTSPDTVGTEKLSSTDLVVPQGTIIAGVLETAINSDLPGMVRAVVSRDVPGFDGTRVLIPRGSRLIGQYSNGVALGQSRAFVIWTRLLRSDGVSVQLGSSATDQLGTAGLSGKVDTHFIRRFGAATLLSVITSGFEFIANSNRGTQVLVGSTGQANQLAGIALQREIDIPPTIKVAQGTPIRVFVAKDLDFSDTRSKRP